MNDNENRTKGQIITENGLDQVSGGANMDAKPCWSNGESPETKVPDAKPHPRRNKG